MKKFSDQSGMVHWTVLEVTTCLIFIIGSMSYFAGKLGQQANISSSVIGSNSIIAPDASFLTLIVSGFGNLFTFNVQGAEIFSLITWAITIIGLLIVYMLIRSAPN